MFGAPRRPSQINTPLVNVIVGEALNVPPMNAAVNAWALVSATEYGLSALAGLTSSKTIGERARISPRFAFVVPRRISSCDASVPPFRSWPPARPARSAYWV